MDAQEPPESSLGERVCREKKEKKGRPLSSPLRAGTRGRQVELDRAMGKTTTTKAARGGKESRPAAKVKPEATPEQKLTKHYRSLHDQIDAGFLANALKTCDKILRLTPTDTLATQTRIQLLIALDRYPAALQLLTDPGIERIYCLYKTGRVAEAAEALNGLDEDAAETRAARLLEAQVKYRSEDYEASRDIYDELLATADADSPEIADLQTNLNAANAHLDFLSAVPSTLASSSVPSLETLESTPVAPLIQSSIYKSAPLVASTLASTSKAPAKKASAAKAGAKGKPAKELDPDRWLPKRERAGFADEIVRRREQERGRKKQQQASLLTQGAAESVVPPPKATGGGGGGGAGGKKKKGKK